MCASFNCRLLIGNFDISCLPAFARLGTTLFTAYITQITAHFYRLKTLYLDVNNACIDIKSSDEKKGSLYISRDSLKNRSAVG